MRFITPALLWAIRLRAGQFANAGWLKVTCLFDPGRRQMVQIVAPILRSQGVGPAMPPKTGLRKTETAR